MRKLHHVFFVAPVALFIAGAALAQVDWLVPPPFEVQRDIYFGFEDPSNPLEPLYLGPDDDLLKDSDFFEVVGLDFFDGKMGIDNRGGDGRRDGSTLQHIDNWDRDDGLKLIWYQLRIYVGQGGYWSGDWRAPGVFETDWNWVASEQHDDGSVTALAFRWIRPNPPWEEWYADVSVPVGDIKWVEYIRVATACVPEPGLIGLVGIGVLGVLARRKR